ncbi:MAG: hypothetical protein C4329_12530, partial [Chitinophagaceae bacterium]
YAKALADADRAGKLKLMGNKYYKIGAWGAGSDWSGFLQHLGIASMNLGFGGEDPAGVYPIRTIITPVLAIRVFNTVWHLQKPQDE